MSERETGGKREGDRGKEGGRERGREKVKEGQREGADFLPFCLLSKAV